MEVRFLMGSNYSFSHGKDMRRVASELIERHAGWVTLSRGLAIPETTAKNWIRSYRAVGSEAFINMGDVKRTYDYETMLAAVLDHVEGGMTRQEVMCKYKIASKTSIDTWVRDYRRGGPDALKPAPKGRPPGPQGTAKPKTREQELDEENRRLRAEVAYLKKLRALEAAKRARGRNAR
ncbi:hypothetical protein Shel_03240 [Slackia heliotrinireducens DSM 20476]|uniref:Insertion element IS150 protein InsJ-like helix-turn-helix domain-containing protein n=2 Tax=Slackia TaxID=84108 RepID=C7N285_SLAHD|nr:hypothetical protein Shel_03240 [Slackia heliotrinireducens DSM 20476]